jgi:hypothetical protein
VPATSESHPAVLGMCSVCVGTLFSVAGVPQIADRCSFDAERATMPGWPQADLPEFISTAIR